MIPRILHYVWVGDRPMPPKLKVNLETWADTHPNFEIKAWTNETVRFDTPYLAHCRDHRRWANAANYLRLAKVLEHGGIYLDTDIMLIGSLERMRRDACFLGFQVEKQENDWVNNAVLGAEPGHWFVERLRSRLLEEFDGSEPANHSSPRLTTRLLVEEGLRRYDRRGVQVKDIRVHPYPTFYPYSWRERFSLAAIRPETVAVHFWDKMWDAAAPAAPDTPEAEIERRLADLELDHQMLIRDALRLVRPARIWRRWLGWRLAMRNPALRTKAARRQERMTAARG